MVIIGIDPGSIRCGYAVIRLDRRDRLTYLDAGEITAPQTWPLAARLSEIGAGINDVLDDAIRAQRPREPFAAGIEAGYAAPGPSALVLGAARGVAMYLIADRLACKVLEYQPSTVKKSVAGSGRAPKEQVAEMARRILKMRTTPGSDCGDALGVAICRARDG